MIERLLITLLIGVVAMAAYHLWLYRQRTGRSIISETGPEEAAPHPPRLLYFRSQYCGVCLAQAHYLEALEPAYRAMVEPIDVEQLPQLAQRYNVVTLPTTILIDSQAQVRYVNPGLTNPLKLTHQLEALVKI